MVHAAFKIGAESAAANQTAIRDAVCGLFTVFLCLVGGSAAVYKELICRSPDSKSTKHAHGGVKISNLASVVPLSGEWKNVGRRPRVAPKRLLRQQTYT